MASVVRELAKQVPRLSRGLQTSARSQGGKIEKWSHEHIVFGDGHHGLRPGYTYDYEHGPHFLQPGKVPNFQKKWATMMAVVYVLGIGVPCFAVAFQQYKLKAA